MVSARSRSCLSAVQAGTFKSSPTPCVKLAMCCPPPAVIVICRCAAVFLQPRRAGDNVIPLPERASRTIPFQYSISCCECPKHICIKSHIEASRTVRSRPEKQGSPLAPAQARALPAASSPPPRRGGREEGRGGGGQKNHSAWVGLNASEAQRRAVELLVGVNCIHPNL